MSSNGSGTSYEKCGKTQVLIGTDLSSTCTSGGCIHHLAIGRKEMFYLTTHSTHYIYGYMADHSDSERGNPLPPHGLLLSINSKGYFICTIPQTGWHIPRPDAPVVEHWLEREIAQWVYPMKDRSDDPSHHEQTLLSWSYISLLADRERSQFPVCLRQVYTPLGHTSVLT